MSKSTSNQITRIVTHGLFEVWLRIFSLAGLILILYGIGVFAAPRMRPLAETLFGLDIDITQVPATLVVLERIGAGSIVVLVAFVSFSLVWLLSMVSRRLFRRSRNRSEYR